MAGPQGNQGIQGFNGDQGPEGVIGLTGLPGLNGTIGPMGPPGMNAAKTFNNVNLFNNCTFMNQSNDVCSSGVCSVSFLALQLVSC